SWCCEVIRVDPPLPVVGVVAYGHGCFEVLESAYGCSWWLVVEDVEALDASDLEQWVGVAAGVAAVGAGGHLFQCSVAFGFGVERTGQCERDGLAYAFGLEGGEEVGVYGCAWGCG